MATFNLPFAFDSSARGIPTGDTGRGTGWFVVGDTDYARAISVAGDGKVVQEQITGVQKPRIRFWANLPDIITLTNLLNTTCSGGASSAPGVINSVTPVAVHKRTAITTLDTAPVPVLATIENPPDVNLTTIWSFSLVDTTFVTTVGPAFSSAPDGSLWTISSLIATEFSLTLVDGPQNINPITFSLHPYQSQYVVDQFYLQIDYYVPSPFPTAAGGGQGCSTDFPMPNAGTGHGWES